MAVDAVQREPSLGEIPVSRDFFRKFTGFLVVHSDGFARLYWGFRRSNGVPETTEQGKTGKDQGI
jgi:hypothetical protein